MSKQVQVIHFAAFLGTGKYESTTYFIGDEIETAQWKAPPLTYVQTAVLRWLVETETTDIAKITIFGTMAARDKHYKELKEEIRENYPSLLDRMEFYETPAGFNQKEAYKLFEVLQEQLAHKTSEGIAPVVWDLTHGFRAQPALAQMVFNYLKNTPSKVEIYDILYGAFDYDAQENTPLVSLTHLWELNDWAEAFGEFKRTGRTLYLSELIEQTRNRIAKRQNQRDDPRYPKLESLSKALKAWDEAIALNQVTKLIGPKGIVNRLIDELQKEQDEITANAARFIRPLQDQMAKDLESMRTDAQWWEKDGLRAQLELLRWLGEHEQYVQFMTIGREWIVTWAQNLVPNTLNNRGLVERVLPAVEKFHWKREEEVDIKEEEQAVFEVLNTVVQENKIRQAFIKVANLNDIRNRINHGGIHLEGIHKKSAELPKSLKREVEQQLSAMTKLYQQLA